MIAMTALGRMQKKKVKMDSQKLQSWASIAEITGGAAIIITLAFLAVEMRSNTNAIQAQTYQSLMQELNDYRRFIAEPDMTLAMSKHRSNGWEALSEEERSLRGAASAIRFGIYESAYFANKKGVLGRSEWARFEDAICRGVIADEDVRTPDGNGVISTLLTDEFRDFINNICDSKI